MRGWTFGVRAAMASVGLIDVTKVYGEGRGSVVAVEGLTLTVGAGELVVLLGPSGCGKTTTLRLVAGLERLSSGSVEIDGRDVSRVAPRDRDVAMVFQNYALYPHLTVYDNLAFGLKMRRTPRDDIRRRVEEVAGILGIEKLLARRPHALSGGQQQRVAFGRAVVRRPSVCLLDEPLANLDSRLRVRVRQELKRMHREFGMTALYVTHDQVEAMALGDRIVVLRNGVARQIGRPQEVFERPADRFVAGFLGSPPMNFLSGAMIAAGAEALFECVGGRVRIPGRCADSVASRVDGEVVLGIRPDRVSIVCGGDVGVGSLSIDVTATEDLGDHRIVYSCMADGQAMVAKLPMTESVPATGRARAVIDVAGVSLFELGECGANMVADVGEVDARTA